MKSISCKGNLLSLEIPVVMGILNITPDSFFTGHLHESMSLILDRVAAMVTSGAAIIDVGGQSTRPGSVRLDATAELSRVLPVIQAIHRHFPELIISIDTYHSEVAVEAIAQGASMVNDISGGTMDHKMIATVGSLRVPYVCMHIQGTPETMQKQPIYKDVTAEVIDFFVNKISECRQAGINDIILDPGFGFGKTTEHNFTLLKELDLLAQLGCPVLAGLSRKSMISKLLHVNAENALNGTTAANMIALMRGASILRVHDVNEAMQAIALYVETKNATPEEWH